MSKAPLDMTDSSYDRAKQAPASQQLDAHHKFSYLPGIFQDYAEIVKSSANGKFSTQPNLGILKRVYDVPSVDSTLDVQTDPQWVRFANYIRYLNKEHAEAGISYKLIYIIRHGRGTHNVKMDQLKASEAAGLLEQIDGRPANWNNYWSHQDGDGSAIWADAHLVDKGIAEATSLSKLWLGDTQEDVLPLPESIYTSPLARCLETTKLVYGQVLTEHGKRFQPVIKENLRERITNHTCDRRSSRSWIKTNYPGYIIEDGFSELDENWDADTFETLEQHIARTQQLFDYIFTHDTSPIISLTTHSYTLTAILALVGYPKFLVNEGTIVPLVVKADRATPNAPLSRVFATGHTKTRKL